MTLPYRLEELVDIAKLQELLDSLYEIAQIPSAIIDVESNILTATAWTDLCTKFHRVNPDTEAKCLESDAIIVDKLTDRPAHVIYKCPMGLVDTATPIIVDGEHIANTFTGQLFTEEPDLEAFRKQAQKYGFDEEAYMDAVKRAPIISEKRLKKNLDFLARFTEMLAEQGLKELRQRELRDAIKTSEERFRGLLDNLDSLVYVADMDSYELLFVNKYGREIFGDIVGQTCWKTLQSGQDGPCDFCTNNKILDEKGEPTGVYVWELQNTKTNEWYECRDQAISWPDGRIVRMEIATNITKRKEDESVIQTVVESISELTGQDFFDNLVVKLCDWLKCDVGLVSILDGDSTSRARAMVADGEMVEDYSYTLEKTPCEDVAEKGFCHFPEDIVKMFPEDKDLADFNLSGYIGTPLRNKHGKTIGILAGMSHGPLQLPERTEEIMSILAARAASEIERMKAEEELIKAYDELEGRTRKWKESEGTATRLGRILEDSLNEIFVFDSDNLKFVEVNRGARENIGYSMEELRCLTPLDIKPEFTPELFAEKVEPLRTGEKERVRFTTVHKRKDGSLYPVEVHLQLSAFGTSKAFVAIILDITHTRELEKETLEAKDKVIEAMERQRAYTFEVADRLRNPMQVFKGSLEMINTRDLKPEQRKELIKNIHESAAEIEKWLKRLT